MQNEELMTNWNAPLPLRKDRSSLPDFPIEALPVIPRAMALGVAQTTSTDAAMSATALLSSLSYCFSGVYAMEGKTDHKEPIVLYSLIFAEPAERKSPVMRFVKAPFITAAKDYNEANKQEIYSSEEAEKKLENEIANMQTNEDVSADEIAAKRAELDSMKPKRFKRACIDDVTPEALAQLLDENGSMLMISDEAGVLKNFGGRYSGGTPNLDLFLKCWGGEMFIRNRCNKPPLTLERPYLSVCLCGQPYILNAMMENGEFRSSGLNARFIYCNPKSYIGKRRYNTKPINDEYIRRYDNLVHSALENKYAHSGEEIILTFDEEAQTAFAEYYDNHIEPVLLTDFAECPDWGGKFHGLILRLCGLLHCVKCFSENVKPESRKVDNQTLSEAIRIAEYYKQQARYSYSLGGSDIEASNAEYILAKIKANNISEISQRDLLRTCRKFKNTKELEYYLAPLIENGHIRISTKSSGTTKLYEVNPMSA